MSTVVAGVGAVVTHQFIPGKILIVEEAKSDPQTGKNIGMLSVPAGHLIKGEDILEAVKREVLEETGWNIHITTFLRFYLIKEGALGAVVVATATKLEANPLLDEDIRLASWMSVGEVLQSGKVLRPGMAEILDDYVSGLRYPLDIIRQCF